MHKNKKNEGLQSRREFFKSAAKGALPILGAIVLANVPSIMSAASESPMGCYGCSGTCKGSCQGSCHYGCNTGCKHSCTAACHYTCSGGSYGK